MEQTTEMIKRHEALALANKAAEKLLADYRAKLATNQIDAEKAIADVIEAAYALAVDVQPLVHAAARGYTDARDCGAMNVRGFALQVLIERAAQ